jgi:hypothetical protein
VLYFEPAISGGRPSSVAERPRIPYGIRNTLYGGRGRPPSQVPPPEGLSPDKPESLRIQRAHKKGGQISKIFAPRVVRCSLTFRAQRTRTCDPEYSSAQNEHC